MDKLVLSEDDIRQLFHSQAQPATELPARGPFPVQKESPAFPQTPGAIEKRDSQSNEEQATPPIPPSPFHRVPSPTQSHKTSPATTPSAAIYTPAKIRYHSRPQRLVRALAMFGVSFFMSFGLLNGGTYGSRLTYWWEADILGQDPVTQEELQKITGGTPIPIETSDTSPVKVTTPSPPSGTPRLPVTPVTLPENRLLIPKIGVDAPVVWNANPANILTDLQKGVAHYQGTALPNDRSGNVFVTGHSSNYVWDRGQYNRIFANLDKLVAGDLVAVTTSGTEYVYRVKDSVVVRPQQTDVLAQTSAPILSLMTCTPVGTNLRRLVVRADLVRVTPLVETNRSIPLSFSLLGDE